MLVVEDQEEALCLARTIRVVEPGFRIMRFSGAEEARAYLLGVGEYAERQIFPLPKVVFADFAACGPGGAEFLEWVRQQKELAWMPVVAVSAPEGPEAERQALERGAAAVVPKTKDVEWLAAELKAVLERCVPQSERGRE